MMSKLEKILTVIAITIAFFALIALFAAVACAAVDYLWARIVIIVAGMFSIIAWGYILFKEL